MYCYIIAGKTRQGKSRYTKSMISTGKGACRPCMVYDIQNEYGKEYKTLINGKVQIVKGVGLERYSPKEKRCRFTPQDGTKEDFENVALHCKGRNIIFEEATTFLKGGMSENIRKIVVSKFHDMNNLMFIFHRLNTVPKDIIDLADYLILFKTSDVEKDIIKRYDMPIITFALKLQQAKKDGSPPTIVNLKMETINGKPIEFYEKLQKTNKLF